MDYSTAKELMLSYHQLTDALNVATEIIGRLPNNEEQKELRRPIGKILAVVWPELMLAIIKQFPDLDPDKDIAPDAPLTAEETASIAQLTEANLREIDDALLSNATTLWRKVAMIIALTMNQLQGMRRQQNCLEFVRFKFGTKT